MNISLLTIHFGVNHGSILQAIATYETLSLMDYDVEIINYIPGRYNFYKEVMKKRYNYLLKLGYYLLNVLKIYRRRRKFQKYLEKHSKLSNKVNRIEDYFSTHKPEFTIVGSDQVWNSDYNDEYNTDYFLENVINSKIISYGSSFGKDTLSEIEISIIAPLLKRFDSVSVREASAVKILKKCGIYSELVLDPTLLLSQVYWSKYIEQISVKYDKYILIYVMDQSYEPLLKIAKQIKEITGYCIITVSFEKYHNDEVVKSYYNISPGQFLKLIHDCSFVVTNSYHGVLFSLNFHKDFYAVRKEKYNTRIENILNIVNLPDRFINESIKINEIKKIDYSDVKERLDTYKNRSLNYIKRSLGE